MGPHAFAVWIRWFCFLCVLRELLLRAGVTSLVTWFHYMSLVISPETWVVDFARLMIYRHIRRAMYAFETWVVHPMVYRRFICFGRSEFAPPRHESSDYAPLMIYRSVRFDRLEPISGHSCEVLPRYTPPRHGSYTHGLSFHPNLYFKSSWLIGRDFPLMVHRSSIKSRLIGLDFAMSGT